MADDFTYTFKTGGFNTIFHDEYLHYLSTNGRSVAHIFVRIFLLMPKMVFNFVNPLIFVGVTFLIYRLTNFSSNKYNTVRYLLIVTTLFLFVPRFGEVFLWETGTINYLWMLAIMLFFITFYHNVVIKNKEISMRYPAVVIFILGILAGWCNENTSGGLLLLTISYMFIHWKVNELKVPLWMKTGLIGEVIGFIIMLNSPGNKIRSAKFERSSWPLPKKIILGMGNVGNSLLQHALPLIMLTLISIIFCIILYKSQYNYLLGIIYFVVGGLTIYSLAFSPAALNWGRSYFGGIVYIIIALNMVFPTFEKEEMLDKSIVALFSSMFVSLVFFAFLTFVPAVLDIYKSYSDLNFRYNIILSEKEKGNMDPVVPDFNLYSKTPYPAYSVWLSHLGGNPKGPDNIYTADYFGVNSVRTVPMKEWQENYKNNN